MWQWTDPIPDDIDWTSVQFLNQFINAVNERNALLSRPILTPVQVGEDIQNVTFSGSFFRKIFQNVNAIIGNFLATKRPDGSNINLDNIFSGTVSDVNLAWPQIHTWSSADSVSLRLTNIFKVAFNRTGNWTHRYPREVSNFSSTAYVWYGGQIQNGHKAWVLSQKRKNVYIRQNGQWEIYVPPVGVQAQPDITESYQFEGPFSGDILGPHLFRELRTIINLCSNRLILSGVGGNPALLPNAESKIKRGIHSAEPYTSVGDVKAATESDFDANLITGSGPDFSNYSELKGFNFRLDGELRRSEVQISSSTHPILKNAEIDFYGFGYNQWLGTANPSIYDDFGDGWPENTWVKRTIPANGSLTIGNQSRPTWCADPPPEGAFGFPNFRHWRGYNVRPAPVAIYNVGPLLTYK